MSESREFVDRIWSAMNQARADGFDATRMIVHVAVDVWQGLRIENPLNVMQYVTNGEHRVFGLQMKRDETLAPGEIVLRYEVAA